MHFPPFRAEDPYAGPALSTLPQKSGHTSLRNQEQDRREISLSRYFPKGTQYFYGYPSGQDSQFFNNVPPAVEEVVAARALLCAGRHVTPIVFAPAMDSCVLRLLQEEIGLSYPSLTHILTLPSYITPDTFGEARNVLLKMALKDLTRKAQFVMAQPYTDASLSDRYQIPTGVTQWLNDKKNLPAYVPHLSLPERYAEYASGAAFSVSKNALPFPCVVKVSSSSSGDGVRICRTPAELEVARKEYASIVGAIVVEQCISVVRNFGIQFGIPYAADRAIEIIGVSEQLTTPAGEFIGGVIDPLRLSPEIDGINRLLLQYVLPKVRSMGWYGIGGFDVLIDRRGRFFIGDPNFRMTGMTTYLCQARNGVIRKSMASFVAAFKGTEEEFRRNIVPIAREGDPAQLLHLISLTHHDGVFRMSGAMYFEQSDPTSIQRNARRLMRLGLNSKALQKLSRNGKRKFPDFPEV